MSPQEGAFEFEARLAQALTPVDPPAELEKRIEATLDSILEAAAEELEAWELSSIKDPRNWPRAALAPAAAVVIGSGAAVGLVVLRTQRKRHRRRAQARGALDLAERTFRDARKEAARVLRDITPDR